MKHLLLALALFTLGCKSSIPDWLDVPGPTTDHGVEVVVSGVVRGSTWMSGVTGTATNVSGTRLTRCSLSFKAYGMHGSVLGTARAEREGLEAGEAWEFEASFPRRIGSASTLSAATVVATR